MRSLFSSAPGQPAAPAAASGWDGVHGRWKLAIAGGAVAAVVALVVVPDMMAGKRSNASTQRQETHIPSAIHDYEAPPAPSVVTASASIPNPERAPAARRVRTHPSDMALYAAPAQQVAAAAPASAASPTAPNMTAAASGAGQDPLGASVSGATVLPTMHATLVRNREFLIKAGAAIPCLQVEAMNSSRPGFTSCYVNEWFPSDNVRRWLLPPKTRIFGQIRSGIAQGETRIGVLYTEIQTPWFDMKLAAPGADAMGRSGLDADLKTFFWDRAGAVALYALMDVAVGTGQNLASSSLSRAMGSGGNTLNFGSQAQGLASQEMASRINRPPVATRDQALPITVMVGQDLDFTDACRKAMEVDPMACPLL